MEDLIKAVKAHATKNYENGWDVVIECLEDEAIAGCLQEGMTENEAIRAVAKYQYLEAHTDMKNDALAAGGLETTPFKMGL